MNKFIAGKNINLRDVEVLDAQFILSLRTNEVKSQFLNKTDSNLKQQEEYISKYKNKENEWYFIIEDKNKEQLGTVRIYDIQGDSFCWGSWLVKDGAPVSTAIESAILLYEYAFLKLGFQKSHFDVRKDNLRVRAFHERLGAKPYKETDLDILYNYTKEDYFSIREKYIKKFGIVVSDNIDTLL